MPEPEGILEAVKNGDCFITRFHGQYRFFIPNTIVAVVGIDCIQRLAEEIYSKSVLQEFGTVTCNWENSVSLELPPRTEQEIKTLEKGILELYKKQGSP